MDDFDREIAVRLRDQLGDARLRNAARDFLTASIPARYSYNFRWLGRPVIQYPQDIVAVQELIWTVKPDVVVETGIAHGGSLALTASILALLDLADTARQPDGRLPLSPKRKVIGVEIDLRPHNRQALDTHPLRPWLDLVDGSSIDAATVESVRARIPPGSTVLVLLDSNHTHDHVLAELRAYAPLVSVGSYCVVFDTVIEDLPDMTWPDRPWGVGDNPATAVAAFLAETDAFVVDREIDAKLLISVARGGYLKRVR